MATTALRNDLLKVFLLCLLSLFLVPAATLVFTEYAQHGDDVSFLQRVDARIDAASNMSTDERQQVRSYYHAHPPSIACADLDPQDQEFHDKVCAPFSEMWQFHLADRTAFWTLVGGAALLLVALALGALAFANRGLRYASFVAGWRLMTWSSAATVLVQGVLCVWLSFWVTAYFWHSYYVKLVALAGICAAVAVFLAISMLFRRFPADDEIEGEPLGEADAPRLWERVRQLAGRVGTAPPDHIVAGIDTNFFVTETPHTVGGQVLRGRTLFVSIPLLRVLDQSEADAVLAHELAHLGGGDTRSGAALGPKLQQFDHYTAQMRRGGLTVVAHYLLRLYRMIFQFALSRASREREYAADRTAAQLVSPQGIVRSLVKIAAYARYRNHVENELFSHDQRHGGSLGIAGFVAEGLHPYATSAAFVDAMKTAGVPHPYDSHPPLEERMRNVGHAVPAGEYGAIVTAVPQASWADEILTAHAIEQRLWTDYEQRFAAAHERSLAYRYEPATDEERALVLKYFPGVLFDLGKERTFEVHYTGMRTSDGIEVPWEAVKGLTYKDGSFGDALVVTHHEKGMLGAKSTTLKLRGIGKQKAALKEAVGQYWHRHQVMRANQSAA
jgi:Zn-dependent protease with chaperone function